MKKWLIVLMCLSIVGCATVPKKALMAVKSNRDFSYIERVAVLPFGPRETVSDKFTTLLSLVSKFDIVERGQLDKVLEEQKLGLSGLLNDKTRKELGKLLGVDALFIGSAETTEHPYYKPPPARPTSTGDPGTDFLSGLVYGWESSKAGAGVDYYTTVNIRLIDIETGDILISCSDGSWDVGGDWAILRIIERLQEINSIFYTKAERYEIKKGEIIDAYLAGDKKEAKKLEKYYSVKVRRSDIKRAKTFKNEPDSFRDIKWGTDISSLSGMNYIEDFSTPIEGVSTPNLKVYTRENDELQIGGAKLEEISYLFYKNKFSMVAITTNGLANFKALKDATFTKFGKGQQPTVKTEKRTVEEIWGLVEQWVWFGETTSIALKYDESSKVGILGLGSPKYLNKVERQMRTDQKQRAKKGAEKGF